MSLRDIPMDYMTYLEHCAEAQNRASQKAKEPSRQAVVLELVALVVAAPCGLFLVYGLAALIAAVGR